MCPRAQSCGTSSGAWTDHPDRSPDNDTRNPRADANRPELVQRIWAFCEALRCGYDLRPIAEAALRNPYQEPITVREVESTWQAVKRVTRDGQAGRSPAVKPGRPNGDAARPGSHAVIACPRRDSGRAYGDR